MNLEIDGASVIYSDDIYNMKAIDADIESGKLDNLLSRAQFDRQGNFIGFKTEDEIQAANKGEQDKSKTKQSDKDVIEKRAREALKAANKRRVRTLAHQLNGISDDNVDWGYNFYANDEAQAFNRALQIYFGNEAASSEKNPLDVEIPDNAITQSAEFKQTLRDMQDVWKDYQRGELDIREAANKIDAAIEDYREKHDEHNVVSSAAVSLWAIKWNIDEITHSPEEQAKHDAGWKKFMALVEKITPLNRAGKLSNEEHAKLDKEIRRLVKQVQGGKITGQTAFERLKAALPENILEEALADVEESGTGAGLADGHRDLESELREPSEEGTRAQGRDKISDEDSGRQRQAENGIGARNSEANAESDRPVQTNDAGGTSARAGDGTGLRGDTSPVQPADGAERGRSRISADDEAVEQRARDLLKQTGLGGVGAFESRGFTVETEPVFGDSSNFKQRVTVKVPREISGLTTSDSRAYDAMAQAVDAVKDEYQDASYICNAEDAPTLKRAFEIYLAQGLDGRIDAAIDKLKDAHEFTAEQLKWLDKVKAFMHNNKAWGTHDAEHIDTWHGFGRGTTFAQVDKIFDGKLAELLDEAYDYYHADNIDEYAYDKKQAAKSYETSGHNFHITDESGIGDGGLKAKFKQNVDAIKLLKQLEAEGRKATPSEQAILAKFNGWGTLASAFSNDAKWHLNAWASRADESSTLRRAAEYSSGRCRRNSPRKAN